MNDQSYYLCNGCRSINSREKGEPRRIEVDKIDKDSGEQVVVPHWVCPKCDARLAKGQPLFPYE